MLSLVTAPAVVSAYRLTRLRFVLKLSEEAPMLVLPKVPVAGGGVWLAQPGSALHTSRRPPLITLPASEGSGSTLPTMSAFSSWGDSEGETERISAAAPATWGEAIEPPLR